MQMSLIFFGGLNTHEGSGGLLSEGSGFVGYEDFLPQLFDFDEGAKFWMF